MNIAGVDEVGRGPLAGPVVAAAVILPLNFNQEIDLVGLTDSKKLTSKQREKFDLLIKETAVCWALGEANLDEIDELNILHATMLAMQRAVAALSIKPDEILVDGNRTPDFGIPASSVIGGDAKHACISAASVIAKVSRDQLMKKYAKDYPDYGWQTNSGYPTKQHLAALQQHGITPHHRLSFAPVAAILRTT